MKTLLLLFLCFAGPGFEEAVLYLCGASCMEDLDQTTLEAYRALELHPVELNLSPRSRLLSCGLLSPFQVAALIDERERSGDILSYTELALVDGFGPEYAEALKPFTRLSSSGPPGKRNAHILHHDLMLRASAKSVDKLQYAAGFRYKASLGEMAELNWAARSTYDDVSPGIGTLNTAYYGRKYLGKVILGHFNARLGQGLAVWSGFSLQPWSSVASFRRSPTGFSATGSYNPGHCGVAADFDYKRWSVAAAYSFADGTPMGYLSYTGKRFTTGLNATSKALSADFRIGLPNVGLYGELCWKGRPEGVLGAFWIPSYGIKIGAMGRLSEGLAEVAAGASSRTLEGVVYYSSKQFRLMGKWSPSLSAGALVISPSIRAAACKKKDWRLEGRGELKLEAWKWVLKSRVDLVHTKDLAWLFNAEAGREAEKFKLFARWTLFRVDSWEGRIYVYERDAPGNFNVPAYYGKGWAASVYGVWKPSRRHSFYLRVSDVEYPWMTDTKSGKLEVKLQYQLSL